MVYNSLIDLRQRVHQGWSQVEVQLKRRHDLIPSLVGTVKGLRDRAILALLIGCGLRRSEVAALALARIQQLEGRWCIVDLNGKHGRIRTVPIPTWVKVAVDAWTSAGRIETGLVFRPINRGG